MTNAQGWFVAFIMHIAGIAVAYSFGVYTTAEVLAWLLIAIWLSKGVILIYRELGWEPPHRYD